MQNKFVRTDAWPTNISQAFGSGFSLKTKEEEGEEKCKKNKNVFCTHKCQ